MTKTVFTGDDLAMAYKDGYMKGGIEAALTQPSDREKATSIYKRLFGATTGVFPGHHVKTMSVDERWLCLRFNSLQEAVAAQRSLTDLSEYVHAQPSAVVQAKVTQFNVGRYCLSEDACINLGIDFAAYERGVSDAANAFGAIEPTAQPTSALQDFLEAAKQDGVTHLTIPATPPPVAGDAELKSLNAMAADLLRPYVKSNQKVIWREAFRWQDDNGVLSNHQDGKSIYNLCEEFGYEVDFDFDMHHACIITKRAAIAAGGQTTHNKQEGV